MIIKYTIMKFLLAKFVTESDHFYNLLFSSHSLTHSLTLVVIVLLFEGEFEYTKGVIRIRKSKMDR
jgi:hypothetical protein